VANESGQTAETGESRKTRGKRQGVGEVVSGIAEILKVALWLSLLILVVFHWSYFSEWFRSATHLELPGIKIDRFDQAAVKVEQYSVTPQARQSGFSPTFAQAAIVRAERVAPALRGALVLWVDDIPENNVLVREILGEFGIRFVIAKSSEEGLQRLQRNGYDLIISNSRQTEPPAPLTTCPVHYFGWPANVDKLDFKGSLDSFNEHINAAAPGGFVFMDKVVAQYKEGAPPIIFYSASTGGMVTSLCSQAITNRADILLQSVVSSLEQQRWQELKLRDISESDEKSRDAR
jgi:CheY-like chemotaxis protein